MSTRHPSGMKNIKVEKKSPKKSRGKYISADPKEKWKARVDVASREAEGHLPTKWKLLKYGETGTASGEAEEREPKSDWLCTMSTSGPCLSFLYKSRGVVFDQLHCEFLVTLQRLLKYGGGTPRFVPFLSVNDILKR